MATRLVVKKVRERVVNHGFQKVKRLICPVALLFIVIVSCGVSAGSVLGVSSVSVTVDYNTVVGNNKLSIGSMLDWEWKAFRDSTTLRKRATETNLKLIRVFDFRKTSSYGIPNLMPCTYWNEATKTGTWDWTQVDSLTQTIFSVGAEPLYCLGWARPGIQNYIPAGMGVNSTTGLPYIDSFAAYVREWVKHFKTVGLPVRFYEIMNEPFFYYGWDKSETRLIGNFVQLLNAVIRAMRGVNSGVLIGNNGFLQKKFLDYFVKYGENLGFIAFNRYGLDENGGTDSAAFYSAKTSRFTIETSNWYTIDQGRTIWNTKRGKILPIIFTESNFSYACMNGSDSRIQQMAGAVYIALVLRESILRGLSYHCYYVFSSSPSALDGSNGFGMVNTDNSQPWYPYYVQQWLSNSMSVGDSLAVLTTSSSEISGFAWTHNQKLYFLLICEANQLRTVYFSGLRGSLNFTKIDNTISWRTPKVQTGKIDSAGSFDMNGYTVALFQAEASAPIPPTAFFEDGFESGNFSKWTGKLFSAGETAAVSATKPYSGFYSARFTTNAGNSWEYAYCYKSLSLSEVYVRGYFNISSGLPLVDNSDRLYLLRLVGSQNLVYAGILRDAGVDKWVVLVRNGANWMDWKCTATPLPQKGTWVRIELHWKADSTQGLAELYINGAKVIAVGGINTAYYGNATRVDFGLPYAVGVQKNIIIRADSAKISKTYIGP